MASKEENSFLDVEAGPCEASIVNESDGSLCFSDADEEHCPSPDESNLASNHEISRIREPCKSLSTSNCSGELDLEIKVDAKKWDMDCRICHLNLESHTQESGSPIVLGCSCKDDLAAAHKQCAETWFKIKGNKTCEICGATAKNVVGAGEVQFMESWNETGHNGSSTPNVMQVETRSFWQGHRFLNFLLACMVFAFVISWLFHFNVRG